MQVSKDIVILKDPDAESRSFNVCYPFVLCLKAALPPRGKKGYLWKWAKQDTADASWIILNESCE